MTGLVRGLKLAGLPGELCGLGGWDGLNVGVGRIGGLCALFIGNALKTHFVFDKFY